MEKRKASDDRVAELEDIICTLKFEINGLKSVVASMEDEASAEKERVKKELQDRAEEILNWVEEMRLEVESRMAEVFQLEAKVSFTLFIIKVGLINFKVREMQEKDIILKVATASIKPVPLPLPPNHIDKQDREQYTAQLKAEKEKIEGLEKQLRAEVLRREKAEIAYTELLEKQKKLQIKPKEKKAQYVAPIFPFLVYCLFIVI